jgi:uncharacterized protein (TIGR02246 family)
MRKPIAESASPQEEAFQVLEQWTQAFRASDVDGIVHLHAADALFFGTGSQTLVANTEGIRTYFEQLKRNRPRDAVIGDYSCMVLSETAVLFTGLDTVSRTQGKKTLSSNGRFTFVVVKRDEGWQIVHFHRSAQPD